LQPSQFDRVQKKSGFIEFYRTVSNSSANSDENRLAKNIIITFVFAIDFEFHHGLDPPGPRLVLFKSTDPIRPAPLPT
jgi:hypothetical protein